MVGALHDGVGAVASMTAETAADGGPSPASFVAVTVKEYVALPTRPLIVQVNAPPVAHDSPVEVCTRYARIAEPYGAAADHVIVAVVAVVWMSVIAGAPGGPYGVAFTESEARP
jgi:hypothetical protein